MDQPDPGELYPADPTSDYDRHDVLNSAAFDDEFLHEQLHGSPVRNVAPGSATNSPASSPGVEAAAAAAAVAEPAAAPPALQLPEPLAVAAAAQHGIAAAVPAAAAEAGWGHAAAAAADAAAAAPDDEPWDGVHDTEDDFLRNLGLSSDEEGDCYAGQYAAELHHPAAAAGAVPAQQWLEQHQQQLQHQQQQLLQQQQLELQQQQQQLELQQQQQQQQQQLVHAEPLNAAAVAVPAAAGPPSAATLKHIAVLMAAANRTAEAAKKARGEADTKAAAAKQAAEALQQQAAPRAAAVSRAEALKDLALEARAVAHAAASTAEAAAEAAAAAVAAGLGYGCPHVPWQHVNRPANNANCYGCNLAKGREQLVRRLAEMLPAAGALFDKMNSSNNRKTGKTYAQTGARWPQGDYIEFLEEVLGKEGQPGSAPWPRPEEFKPLTVLLYLARLLRWLLGRDNITAAHANGCWLDGSTCTGAKNAWHANRAAVSGLGVPMTTPLPLQPVPRELQLQAQQQAQQQVQQQQQQQAGPLQPPHQPQPAHAQQAAAGLLQAMLPAAGQAAQQQQQQQQQQQAGSLQLPHHPQPAHAQPAAAGLLQTLLPAAGQAHQAGAQQQQQQRKVAAPAEQQASVLHSSRASEGTGFSPPAGLTGEVAVAMETRLQVHVQHAHNLRQRGKRNYSSMAAGN